MLASTEFWPAIVELHTDLLTPRHTTRRRTPAILISLLRRGLGVQPLGRGKGPARVRQLGV